MNNKHYILEGHEIKEVDLLTWAAWFGSNLRHVAQTELGEVNVSTVFLGLDHNRGDGPPLLFETMIFGGEHDQYQDRYATWDEAVAGHDKACELVTQDISRAITRETQTT